MSAAEKVERIMATDNEPWYSKYSFMAYLVLRTVGGRQILTSFALLSSMVIVLTSEGT